MRWDKTKVGSHGTCRSFQAVAALTSLHKKNPKKLQDETQQESAFELFRRPLRRMDVRLDVRAMERLKNCHVLSYVYYIYFLVPVSALSARKRPRLMYVQSVGADRGEGDHAPRLVHGGLWGCSPSIFINQAFQGAVRGSIMRVITQAGCQSYYHRDPSLEITLSLLLVK